jgi:hypothetical protein
MKFYDNFIGDTFSNSTQYFVGGDSKEQLNDNIKTQPSDWYYRDKQITYKFNKHGHRSKEISDLDLDNYILFTGCSHTQGVGLELETTYPHLVSKELNMDYYNLGLAATGPDVVLHNLLNWWYTVRQKPKIVVIQWPDHSRFLSYNLEYDNLIEKGSWQDDSKRFIVDAEDYGLYYARKKLITELVSNIIDVPIIKFNYAGQVGYDSDPIKMFKCDVARDLSHSGIKTHSDFSKILSDLAIQKLNT